MTSTSSPSQTSRRPRRSSLRSSRRARALRRRPPTSHFARFPPRSPRSWPRPSAKDPGFDPARPVLETPAAGSRIPPRARSRRCSTLPTGRRCPCSCATSPTRDETPAQLAALQATAFFPLMTTAIRPLGEILTPAAGPCAAIRRRRPEPAFDFTRTITLHPHRRAAWPRDAHPARAARHRCAAARRRRLRLTRRTCATRLELVYENTSRMAMNFSGAMGIK